MGSITTIREIIYTHEDGYIYQSIERKLLEYSEYVFTDLGETELSLALETIAEMPIDYARDDLKSILQFTDEPLAKALEGLIDCDPFENEEQWIEKADTIFWLINKQLPALGEGFVTYFSRV